MMLRHEAAAPEALLVPARRAIARLGTSRLRAGYFTTFWWPRKELEACRGGLPASAFRFPRTTAAGGTAPARTVAGGSRKPEAGSPIERLVAHLWTLARPPRDCTGVEWWIGRAYTNALPIGFHFDQDVKGAAGAHEPGARRALRTPLLSSVLFFNRVRGGQLAVTDQRPGPRGEPRPRVAGALEVAAPRRNLYVVFAGDLWHGVLDRSSSSAEGRGHASDQPAGRLRVTLVVNYWQRRPTGVPLFAESRAYPALRR